MDKIEAALGEGPFPPAYDANTNFYEHLLSLPPCAYTLGFFPGMAYIVG